MKTNHQQTWIRRLAEILTLYLFLALVCSLLKVVTPLFANNAWTDVLVIYPAGATGVAVLHRLLVNWLMKRN